MGAVSFSLDFRLVASMQAALKFDLFVETGTFKGDTVEAMREHFPHVISIELSPQLSAEAKARFAGCGNVEILCGNSGDTMLTLRDRLQSAKVLYYLDAHWCAADDTAGARSQCPLLGELQAIGSLSRDSVIVIDDARLFLAPPPEPHEVSQWPSFQQVLDELRRLSSCHRLLVVNDVVLFFPDSAESSVMEYARTCGLNWLDAARSLGANKALQEELERKEAVIRQLRDSCAERERLIVEQTKAIHAFQLAYRGLPFVGTLARVVRRSREIVSPRLGNLNQYAPRPLLHLAKAKDRTSPFPCPRISIVTPSYGQGHYIERTLLSVLGQQYGNLEYFVQDGGSLDSTVSVLQRYETRLAGWASERDNGQAEAINRGFSRTSGQIMAWLNSDDILLPGALATVAEFFNRHPEVDVVYGNRLLVDESDMEIGRWILPGHDSAVLSWADYVPQETLFWRRRIWEDAGGYVDESFKFAMDWDLLVRFRDSGATFAHIPQFIGAFRIHEHQKTSAAINEIGHQEMDRIRERLLGRRPSRREIQRAVLPFLLRHVATDMRYRVRARLSKVTMHG